MVGYGNQVVRDVLRQFLFHTEGSRATVAHQSQSVADTEHVCVYRHGSFVEHNRLNDIGCLAAYAWQFDKFFQRVGHLAVEVVHQHRAMPTRCFALLLGYETLRIYS